MRWRLITGEYPPQPGGVSDYTRQLAIALVGAGDEVEVFAPHDPRPSPSDDGVIVHRLPDHFGVRGLHVLDEQCRGLPRDVRVLVQYVPHMYGYKGMNVGFASWLRFRAPRYWVMFHEVAYGFARRQKPSHNVLAAVTHGMAALAAGGAERIFVSMQGWEPMLRRHCFVRRASIHWLPIPSNLPAAVDLGAVRGVRDQLAPRADSLLLGHFGTFDARFHDALIRPMAAALRRDTGRSAVMIGRGSENFVRHFFDLAPDLQGRVWARDGLPAKEVAEHLAACDLLVQPYVDGISSRRSSAMAGLALGRPIVSTDGPLTESLWRESGIVELVRWNDDAAIARTIESLLASPAKRAALGERGLVYYKSVFDWTRVVAQLRSFK